MMQPNTTSHPVVLESLEDFKFSFRKTSAYFRLHAVLKMGEEKIFKTMRVDGVLFFAKLEVYDAYVMWNEANKRAAAIAIRMTEIPKDAKNPTRDRIVEVGEHISEAILK